MKKAFTVIAAALIPLAFWGCSDDSSADNTTEVIGEELPDGNLVDGGGEQAEGQSGENLPVGNQDVAYTGFAEAGLNWRYITVKVVPGALDGAMAGVRALPVSFSSSACMM